jgi:hypothetical protein
MAFYLDKFLTAEHLHHSSAPPALNGSERILQLPRGLGQPCAHFTRASYEVLLGCRRVIAGGLGTGPQTIYSPLSKRLSP